MMLSDQAEGVLRAMRGSLLGCLERDEPFSIDPGWTGPVPREIAEELHAAGFIEIDEAAPIQIPFVFRISAAGRAYLASTGRAGAS
jgi:hypothetical protein